MKREGKPLSAAGVLIIFDIIAGPWYRGRVASATHSLEEWSPLNPANAHEAPYPMLTSSLAPSLFKDSAADWAPSPKKQKLPTLMMTACLV